MYRIKILTDTQTNIHKKKAFHKNTNTYTYNSRLKQNQNYDNAAVKRI